MKKYILLGFLLFLSISLGYSQESFSNTLRIDSVKTSPPATLQDIDWIQGHWQGEAFGGIVEEVWTPPLGGSMMCAFKLVVNDEVRFYEIVTISEEKETLILRLKHFHKDLKGWEEKNETVDFPLVKVTSGKVFFDGFTFEKISDNEMNIYVIIGEEGKEREAKFNYKRVLQE
jgi:hypothetical protein